MGKVACYIDGFNLYHAIVGLNRPHLKWVNLFSLAESLTREKETLVAVNYFSAYATWLPGAYARHRRYIAALGAMGVTPIMAHFKYKDRSCRRCGHTWTDHEEKETDVRLALKILEDATDSVFDRAIIISADSDLVPVVQTLIRKFPKKTVLVATPPKRYAVGRDLLTAAHSSIAITPGRIAKHLLPDQLIDNSGNVLFERPHEYDPPGP